MYKLRLLGSHASTHQNLWSFIKGISRENDRNGFVMLQVRRSLILSAVLFVSNLAPGSLDLPMIWTSVLRTMSTRSVTRSSVSTWRRCSFLQNATRRAHAIQSQLTQRHLSFKATRWPLATWNVSKTSLKMFVFDNFIGLCEIQLCNYCEL